MSYGKFGMKMRYNPYVSPQEQFGESLGNVLGTIWGENYNRRGIEKGEQEALKALYGEGESSGAIGGSGGGSNNVPQELYQQAVGSGAIGASGNTPSVQASASTPPAAGGVIGASGDSGLNDRISAQDKIANEKWGILSAKYGSGTDNPDGDKKIIGQTASTINNNLSSIPRGQLPITDSKALSYSIEAQLRKNGRTDYQIQQIMKNIGPQIDARVQENKDVLWEQYKDLLDKRIQSGELDNAMVTYAEMSKLDPVKTKALERKVNRMWEPFDMQRKFELSRDFYKKNDSSLTDKQASNYVLYGGSIYSPTEMVAMGYTPNSRGGYSAPRIRASGGGGGGGRSRGGGSGTKAEKQAAWKDRVAWANSVLANENAAPEMKQSATRVLAAYDRAMAGNEYVMPYADVQRYVENAIGSGLLTPEQAYDWAFDDSGLGDDEARTLGMWIRDNYMNNDNVSEDTRDAFFSLGDKAEEPEPEEQPNANGHTGILASLEGLGDEWNNFKLKDVANWVKNH